MLAVYLFGKTKTTLDSKPAFVFQTLKAETLFYYLVCENKSVRQTQLAALFWPELPPRQRLSECQASLAYLQTLLGEYLTVTTKSVALNRNLPYKIDLKSLDWILETTKISYRKKLQMMKDLYRGPFLADLEKVASAEFGDWCLCRRQTIERRVLDALRLLAETFLRQADVIFGLKALRWWLTLEPCNEVAHRLLMQLFWQSNQRSAALLQYKSCCENLQAQCQIEPEPETQALYLQILRDETPSVTDNQPSSTVSTQKTLHNLPNMLTNFVGREQETEMVLHHILQQKQRFISIVGEGGVGKTRLALAVAESAVTNAATMPFRDGVWFVTCAGIDASSTAQEQLVINIATILGMHFQGKTPLVEQLTDYLSDKAMLLIIDNFEHLEFLEPILLAFLHKSPHLQLLVTSRHETTAPHALCLRIEGLATPPFVHYATAAQLSPAELAELLQFASIQLLQERSRKLFPTFVINQQNGLTATKLCRLLEGNPLALELAATLVVMYDLETILNELTRNYSLLQTEFQDIPPRHRSIYNTIDYSWQMLSPALASLLAQCSTFRGRFGHEAATTITAESLSALHQLVQRSLLIMDGQHHLRMHEMVRQFAAEKLAPDQELACAANRKHSVYYVSLLQSWWESTQSKHIVATLMPALDNIYTAWEWAFNHQLFGMLSRAIIPFAQFHIYAGLFGDTNLLLAAYYQKLQEKISLLPTVADAEPYIEMQTALAYASGSFCYYLSQFAQAEKHLLEAQTQIYQYGYLYLAANVERFVGNLCHIAGRVQESLDHLALAIHYAETQAQPYAGIAPLINLASMTYQLERYAESEAYLQRAHALLQQYPDVTLEASYHSAAGDLYHAMGHWSDALTSNQKAIQLLSQQRSPVDRFHTAGKILWQSGHFVQAKEYLERVSENGQSGLYYYGGYWHTVLLIDFANLYNAWQQPEQALFYSRLATATAKKNQWRVLEGRALKAEGTAHLQLEEWETAKENLNQSAALFRQEMVSAHECSALTQLIQLHLAQEDEEEIITYSKNIWELLQSGKLDGTNAEPIKAWWSCFLAFRALGDMRTEDALRKAVKIFQSQLAQIHDEAWRQGFSTQIPEHRLLQQVTKSLYPTLLNEYTPQGIK